MQEGQQVVFFGYAWSDGADGIFGPGDFAVIVRIGDHGELYCCPMSPRGNLEPGICEALYSDEVISLGYVPKVELTSDWTSTNG